MQQNYTISIIIPTYNRASLLPQALSSCLNQTYPILEILVIDDCSTDNTPEILSIFTKENASIKYVPLPQNRGAQYARIVGIQQAIGDLIVFLDSDDELLADSVEIRVNALRNSGFSEALVFGFLENVPLNNQNTRALCGYEYPYLLKEQVVCSYITLLVNKSCFEKSGFPSAHFPACQDDDLVLTICKHFPIVHCLKPVAKISTVQDSISYNRRNLYLGHTMLLEKYKQDMIHYCGQIIYQLWRLRLWTHYLLCQIQDHSSNRFYHRIINFGRKIIIVLIRKSMALFFDKYYL